MTECDHEACDEFVEIRELGDDDEGHEVWAYWCTEHHQWTDGDPEEATADVFSNREHERSIGAWLQSGGYGFNDG